MPQVPHRVRVLQRKVENWSRRKTGLCSNDCISTCSICTLGRIWKAVQLTLWTAESLALNLRHLSMIVSTGTGSSQSKVCNHTFCKINFSRIITGASQPTVWNDLAASDVIVRLVTTLEPELNSIALYKHHHVTCVLWWILNFDLFSSIAKTPDCCISNRWRPRRESNPRYKKVIQNAIQHFKKYDLGAPFVITNVPGRSVFNKAERRMAPLSNEIVAVILQHDFYGSPL